MSKCTVTYVDKHTTTAAASAKRSAACLDIYCINIQNNSMSPDLPAKPEPGEISPKSPSPERRYMGRPAPMAPPSQYAYSRREDPRRDDVYIAHRSPSRPRPSPAYVDSYVASDRYALPPPDYDRGREYAERERLRDGHARDYHGPSDRRDSGGDRRNWERERERDGGGRNWEPRREFDRRDRGCGRRGSERPSRPREPDRKWRTRASVSPSRRIG